LAWNTQPEAFIARRSVVDYTLGPYKIKRLWQERRVG
jgi:hypothetical protein